MHPTVSVIIPTYNRAYCVTAAIDSVLHQTYKDVEIIVVDDGSTDNTQEVLSPYIKSGKIHYIRQQNAGVSAARNAGIRWAKGEWIACLDSDDQWLPNKLQRQMKVVDYSPVELGCVFCNIAYEYPIGKASNSFENAFFLPSHAQGICYNMSSILMTRFLMFNQCAIIQKKYIEAVGGYDERLKILEDYDLALKLSFLCNWGYDSEPLVIYGCSSDNSLSAKTSLERQHKTILLIFENLKLFLQKNQLKVPSLLCRRIGCYRFTLSCQKYAMMRTFLKIYNYLYRRTIFYPVPKIDKIEIPQ